MNAKDVLRLSVEMSYMVSGAYVNDLDDADLLVRVVPNSNHIAWQLGHLITSTHGMLQGTGCSPAALPAGFADRHAKETSACDDPARFDTKAVYQALMAQAKADTLAAIEAIPEADLDKPGPEQMREYAPTIGSVLYLAANHWMMHAGQFVSIRRKLGKPVLM
jgi:hypothetical protein